MTIPILGEANITRFFSRLLGLYDSGPQNIVTSATMDAFLAAGEVISSSSEEGKANNALEFIENHLTNNKWILGEVPSLVDGFLISVLYKYKGAMKRNLQQWFNGVETLIS